MAIIRKRAKNTLTAVEMHCTDVLHFTLASGKTAEVELLNTQAEIIRTDLSNLKVEKNGARTDIRFWCDVKINGSTHRLEREISTPKSFYEPWEIDGLRIWLDAVEDIFKFMTETHGACRPAKHARFGIQDATLGICPEAIHPWCPLPEGGLRIEDCYRGEDCWLGAYNGSSAHGGLDINHPDGTPLWVPLDVDDQFYFNSLEMGHNNNRWRGIRHWDNGAVWIMGCYHITELLVPEHKPLKKGLHFAKAAGVRSGVAEHSHFDFKIHDEGETVLLDPWILFWQMYRDQAKNAEAQP